MANIHYIRAAIEQNTGIKLTLEETRDILVEEGLMTKAQAKQSIFRGYGDFYSYFYKHDRNVIEATQKPMTPLETDKYIEKVNNEKK